MRGYPDDRARKVMALAYAEASRLRHDFIGTEHLLLGLAQQEDTIAGCVLEAMGVRARVSDHVDTSTRPVRWT